MQPSRRRPLPRVRRLGRQSTPLRRLRHRSTAGCAFCGYRRSSDVRWFGHRSSARSPPRSAAQAATSPGPPTFQTAVRPRPTPQRVHPGGSASCRLRPPARRPWPQSGLPVCSGYSPELGPESRESPCALVASRVGPVPQCGGRQRQRCCQQDRAPDQSFKRGEILPYCKYQQAKCALPKKNGGVNLLTRNSNRPLGVLASTVLSYR